MKFEDDTTDVTIDKDGAMKIAGDDDQEKDEKASIQDIVEFVPPMTKKLSSPKVKQAL